MKCEIQKVLTYIETHLDEKMDVDTLSSIAGYSSYHFCRLFKANVHSSLMNYVTQKKLQRAVSHMQQNSNLLQVALEAGYETPSGFIKAFKTHFNMTPSEYKLTMHTKKTFYTKERTVIEVTIVQREEEAVVYSRELGAYEQSSQKAWSTLSAQMQRIGETSRDEIEKKNLQIQKGKAKAYGICHDDPENNEAKALRYDAALAWGDKETEFLATKGLTHKIIAGGSYVSCKYIGISQSTKSWNELYLWITKNGYQCRDEPPFEEYLNALEESDPQKFENIIYVPVC